MNKTELKQVIKEVLNEEAGHSKYIEGGKTPGLTQDVLNKILLKLAKEGEEPEDKEVDRMQEIAGITEIKVKIPDNISIKNRLIKWFNESEGYKFEKLGVWFDNFIIKNSINNDFTLIEFKIIWDKTLEFRNTGDEMADFEFLEPSYKWIMDGNYRHFDNFI
jgi:hypothetical protein